MKITTLGHAGLKVETANATLLLDPWFSPEGAFQGSWFQFPDNSHLLREKKLYHPTAILISHEHLDHVDPWFLRQVPAQVPVIVPRYPSPVLRQKILLGGPRQIIEAAQWEAVEIAPGTRVFFVSEPPMNHDSAMVVIGDGHCLLNLNDARLFPMQLRDIRQKAGGRIDILTFQGAGASWFPICYGYTAEKAQAVSRQKKLSKFAYCLKSMKIVEPVIGLPIAGPPAFLDATLFGHNAEMEGGIFPDQQQVADWLATKGFETAANSEERITVQSDGTTYSISRYCPHAGNDLLHTGEVLPGGIMRCLAHHYDFDLNTGKCITSACEGLKVEQLSSPERE